MIRKGNKTLHSPPAPLFSQEQWIILYAIFSIAIVFHVFRLSKPEGPALGEKELYDHFDLFSKGKAPLDIKPISGRFLLFIPYYLLTNNDITKLGSCQFYLRLISSLLSSLATTFTAAALMLKNSTSFSALSAGILLSLDGSFIICTKLYTTDSLFLFFVSLTIFFSGLSTKRRHPLILQAECFFAVLASCTDQIGFVMIIYVMLTNKEKRLQTTGTVLSLFLVFMSAELSIRTLFSDEVKKDMPDAAFADQTVETAKRMNLMINIPKNAESMLYWSVIKLHPVPVWKGEASRIVAVYNIPLVVFVSLAAFLGILNPSAIFFWLSIVAIWAVKKVEIISYTLPLIFGVMALAEAFDSMHEVIRKMMLVVIIVIILLAFIVFFPWTYGIEVNADYDHDIDFWNH